ncbi:UDP-N-acetylglucosamine--dolichyl-phosphate N-acetylglucosaminephosphotransferase-like isoform X2 [Varroa jacobsoni]|uniref:UDP-N-acetylglucosamine--dolichyl-phosphate N-acetylglucosaminephosphotransferase n=1 Tax=Varroa destructor TaxID=109461 RepID=A0A7M7KRH9_VARDE|nr:UDP-N-acetylglucosamine--dolichyl-phosphate N-acetylglucosaminephosphotransferase-like isoform X2 [Varroa destructor]XP_022694452.1 UDP-N-acetylglucosamine--dolichyl-phosphate N-acetylglucosaminephosphotransferase-like isoform X2 [Varroa jacobsoni]
MEKLMPLVTNTAMAVLCYVYTKQAIKTFAPMFVERGLFGIDLCKSSGDKIAESLGVISATCFLVQVFLFIPIPFLASSIDGIFAYDRLVEILAALLSICCMILLGFADDVLDLKWRDKLVLPTLGSLPLLMVYYVNFNVTTVIVPKPLRFLIGGTLYLGPLYYVYMGMLAVFCTNAINILAGVNGLEVGQSLVIAGSIMIFNVVELFGRGETGHLLSLYLMPAFFATSFALYKFNKYPSKIINFLYSTPQLFKLIPCPRHRLPAYSKETGLLSPSTVTFREDSLSRLGRRILRVFKTLKIVQIRSVAHADSTTFEMNNLTIINWALAFIDPMNEGELVRLLLKFQIACNTIAFILYYALGHMLF